MSPRGSIKGMTIVTLATALLSLGFWWSTLGVGLLSDDWLLPQFLLPGSTGARDVDWRFVLEDFTGSWFHADGAALYRPLVSVSVAFDLARGGLIDPSILHSTNLAIHTLSTVLVTVLAHRLAARSHALAAAIAGAAFTLHPIATEPVAWIVGRNSGLVVLFVLGATLFWVLYLQCARKSLLVVSVASSLLALLTKETALVLPVFFVAFELVGRSLGSIDGTSVRAFLLRHLAWAPLWILYLAWRVFLFGGITGEGLGQAPSIAAWSGGIVDRIALLFVPAHPYALGVVACGLLVLGLVARLASSPRSTSVALAVLAASMLAGFAIGADVEVLRETGNGSRILLVFVPCVAALAPVLIGAAKARAPRLALLLVPLVIAWTFESQTRKERYLGAASEMTAFVDAMRQATRERDVTNAQASLVAPSEIDGVPFLNANAVFPVVTAPMNARSAPLIGLGSLLQRLPDQPELYHDAGPMRAVLEGQGELLVWVDGKLIRFAPPTPVDFADLAQDENGEWRLPGALSPFALEAVDVSGPFAPGARLRIVAADGNATPDRLEPQRAQGRMRFDLSRSIHVASLAFSGGVRGFRLEGDDSVEARTLRPRRRIDDLVVPVEASNARCEITPTGQLRFDERLEPLRNPAADNSLRVVVLSAGVGYAFSADGNTELVLPPRVVEGLRRFERSDRVQAIWVYWERPASGRTPSARSRLLPLRYRLRAGESTRR